jgi:hypothetical protein
LRSKGQYLERQKISFTNANSFSIGLVTFQSSFMYSKISTGMRGGVLLFVVLDAIRQE